MFNEKDSAYPVAERMVEKTLTIPTHPNMNIKNLDQIINQLNYWEV
jgi:dTDP-4-amino-4,6-dideoxygalactose transaminase